jgi:hypothetical protein
VKVPVVVTVSVVAIVIAGAQIAAVLLDPPISWVVSFFWGFLVGRYTTRILYRIYYR